MSTAEKAKETKSPLVAILPTLLWSRARLLIHSQSFRFSTKAISYITSYSSSCLVSFALTVSVLGCMVRNVNGEPKGRVNSKKNHKFNSCTHRSDTLTLYVMGILIQDNFELLYFQMLN